MPFASLQSSGGTDLVQEESGVHSAGYVQMDEKMICGETWDLAASQVVCRELGWGPPVEVAGYAKDFLGSLSESPCHVLKIFTWQGVVNTPLCTTAFFLQSVSIFGWRVHDLHLHDQIFLHLRTQSQNL